MPLDRPKILIVTTVPETARAFLLPQFVALVKNGFEVHLATGIEGDALAELKQIPVTEHRFNFIRDISPFSDIKAIWALYKLCRKHQFDIIHTHTLKASLIGQLTAKLSNIPVRFETVHGIRYLPDMPWLMRKSILIAERTAASCADRIWVLNSEDRDFFLSHKLATKEKIELLGKGGIGVDLVRFRPSVLSLQQRADFRSSVGLLPDATVIGFVGRPVRDKGVMELIEAWPQITKKAPNAKLVVICAELPSERSSELIGLHKLQTFPGTVVLKNRSDMPELYGCMDMLVLPSYREGFSRVIIEALSCGLPVIASDVRGCRDAIVNNKTGILIPPKNSHELVDSVLKLVSNPNLLKQMSIAAREYAVDNFDENAIIAHILRSYFDLCDRRKASFK